MKQLSNRFIGNELSHATMRTEDLIPDFMGFLYSVSLYCEIENEIAAIQKEVDELELEEHKGYGTYYKNQEKASDLLNDDIWDLLNDIAPEFCYFGSQEDDGAAYGFWTSDEVLNESIREKLGDIISDRGISFILDYQQVKAVCENILETLNNHDR
jgi:hypothetical protein